MELKRSLLSALVIFSTFTVVFYISKIQFSYQYETTTLEVQQSNVKNAHVVTDANTTHEREYTNISSSANQETLKLTTGPKSYSRCSTEQRKANVKQACAKYEQDLKGSYNPNQKWSYEHLMVDDIHKVLYCYVPKAGCTSWKHVIALASGKVKPETLEKDWNIVHTGKAGEMGLRRLSGNSIEDIHRKLKEYTKFMIVRNPLSRIYSAYNDKFIMYYRTYAKVYYPTIMRQLYPRLPVVNGEKFLSFEKLIQMIIRAHKRRESWLHLAVIDEHWRIVTKMCHPCFIDYDYIGKVETIEQDKGPLLKLFNATELPHAHVNKEYQKTQQNIFNYKEASFKEAFSNLPNETLRELVNIFKVDFDVLGYQPQIEDKAVCGYQGSDNCC